MQPKRQRLTELAVSVRNLAKRDLRGILVHPISFKNEKRFWDQKLFFDAAYAICFEMNFTTS